MSEQSRFVKLLRKPGFLVILFALASLAIAIGPIDPSVHHPRYAAAMQQAHVIGLAMYAYSNDHDQKYPTGKSSTEVFQKLIDGGYVSDPALFYCEELHVPGKFKATSNKLKPENVCWDVTTPANVTSSDSNLPLIFSTGFKIDYAPGGEAVPDPNNSSATPYGIAVYYINNSATFLTNDGKTDHRVPKVVSDQFRSEGIKYMQLTPDGTLP